VGEVFCFQPELQPAAFEVWGLVEAVAFHALAKGGTVHA